MALRLAAIPSCSVVTSRRIDELLQWHLFRPSVRYGSVAAVTYWLRRPRLRRGGGDSTATCTATAKLAARLTGLQAAVTLRRAIAVAGVLLESSYESCELRRAAERVLQPREQVELAGGKTLAKAQPLPQVRLG